jgi:hypothetical protein
MKRTVMDFRRTAAGEWLVTVLAPGFWGRLVGVQPRREVFWRQHRHSFWAMVWTTPSFDHTPACGTVEDWRGDAKLQRALEAWEHDQPITFHSPSMQELFECDCGRQHRDGYLCLQGDR